MVSNIGPSPPTWLKERKEVLGQFSSTVEQDCTTKKDDLRVFKGGGGGEVKLFSWTEFHTKRV
jgi:hypothetical protein